MENKIDRMLDNGDYRVVKINELIGMINEHTDKLNEIIQSLSKTKPSKEGSSKSETSKVCPKNKRSGGYHLCFRNTID